MIEEKKDVPQPVPVREEKSLSGIGGLRPGSSQGGGDSGQSNNSGKDE